MAAKPKDVEEEELDEELEDGAEGAEKPKGKFGWLKLPSLKMPSLKMIGRLASSAMAWIRAA